MAWLVGLSLAGALAVGIWLGLPRRQDYQTLEEIDERLLEKGGSHRRVRRRITFLNLLQKKAEKGTDKRLRRDRKKAPFHYE